MSDESAFDYLFKILMIGDNGTGKTNILRRFISDRYFPNRDTTMNVEFSTRNVSIDNKIVKVQCWDTVGEEKYKSIASAYYRGAIGALLVYDITSRATFDHCSYWLDELREFTSSNIVTLLVGNKTDLRHLREVSSDEGSAYAKLNNLVFVETSAHTGANIEKAFHSLLDEIIKNLSADRVTDNEMVQNYNDVVENEQPLVMPMTRPNKKNNGKSIGKPQKKQKINDIKKKNCMIF